MAGAATRVSTYDAAVRNADTSTREAARLGLIRATRAARLLAAQRATLDDDGCRIVDTGSRGMSGASEQHLIAQWLSEGVLAVRANGDVVTTVQHHQQRDIPPGGISGGFCGSTADGRAVRILLLPPIMVHDWNRGAL